MESQHTINRQTIVLKKNKVQKNENNLNMFHFLRKKDVEGMTEKMTTIARPVSSQYTVL